MNKRVVETKYQFHVMHIEYTCAYQALGKSGFEYIYPVPEAKSQWCYSIQVSISCFHSTNCHFPKKEFQNVFLVVSFFVIPNYSLNLLRISFQNRSQIVMQARWDC